MWRKLVRASIWAVSLSVLFSLLLSIAMVYVDWRENPSGIFRDGDGTHWDIVCETFISWFEPSLIAIFPFVMAIRGIFKIAKERSRQRS